MNTASTPELTPSVHHFALRGLRRFRRWLRFLVIFFGVVGILLGWMQAAERAFQGRDWQADLVNLLGIVTILITLVDSTVSLHLIDQCGQQGASPSPSTAPPSLSCRSDLSRQ